MRVTRCNQSQFTFGRTHHPRSPSQENMNNQPKMMCEDCLTTIYTNFSYPSPSITHKAYLNNGDLLPNLSNSSSVYFSLTSSSVMFSYFLL